MKNLDYVDLHIHTTNSDGTFSCEEIIKKAKELNLKAISITDHESVMAYNEILDKQGIEIINGVELVVLCKGFPIEVLCYGYDQNTMNNFITSNCLAQAKDCEIKAKRLVNIFKSLDVNIDFDLNGYDYNNPSKWVFRDLINYIFTLPKAKKLLQEENKEYLNGYKVFFRKGINNVYSKFYTDMSDLYISIEKLSRFAKENKFLIFLAHPFEYGENAQEIVEYAKSFVDGIEVLHPSCNTNDKKDYLLNTCTTNKLLISGGSDFHGFRGELNSQKVPYSALEKIKEKLNQLRKR